MRRHEVQTSSVGTRARAARRFAAPLIVAWLSVTALAAQGTDHSVVVVGIDGMDHKLTRSLMAEGKLPNLKRLADEGTFLPLGTTTPPLSPVAWSTFITGADPGEHGVFDFLRRDPAHVGPRLLPLDAVCDSATASSWVRVPFTRYALPADARPRLLRRGRPFWERLAERGVPVTVYKVPANYPVAPGPWRVLSGMGTPDVEGTYGTFSLFTDDVSVTSRKINGGRIVPVRVMDGSLLPTDPSQNDLSLVGPSDPFVADHSDAKRTRAPLTIMIDTENRAALVSTGSKDVVLREQEWSPWVEVEFPLALTAKTVRGWSRFYLQSIGPHVRLYCTPVHLSAGAPGLSSGGLDAELYAAIGRFSTKGMPEETKALTQGIFTPAEYLAHADSVLGESEAAARHLMTGHRRGLLFVYFSTLDLTCHALWRGRGTAPSGDASETGTPVPCIIDLYVRMDRVVGDLRAKAGPGTSFYIISDHGFAPVYRQFNLTNWLQENGYLAFAPDAGNAAGVSFDKVDWSRTRAYTVGFQALYVNLKGRESSGTVEPSDRNELLEQIRRKLLATRDPGPGLFRGRPVFASVRRADEVYRGAALADAPDLVLGYARGYSPTDDSVLGVRGASVFADQVSGFTGHHTSDAADVPGVLFVNRRIEGPARLEDVTATLLEEFGVAPSPPMSGKVLR